MQCQQCQFENMPGLTRCMRCGSVLGAPPEPISVMPPRMSGWKRPVRGFFRMFRKSGIRTPQTVSMPPWAVKLFSQSLFGVIFSVIPGLAHLLTRQFGTIWLYCLVWVVLAAGTIFLWGSLAGMCCFGLTLAVHVWIAMRAGFLKQFSQPQERTAGLGIILLLYFCLYYFGSRLVMYQAGIQTGYSIVNVPSLNVRVGSFLIGRTRNITPQRGDLVCANLRALNRTRSTGFVRVVGLPGETVEIGAYTFNINGRKLDPNEFPLPAGFAGVGGSLGRLSDTEYFVVAEFYGTGYNINHLRGLCVLTIDDFESLAFLRWWPLRDRGYIENPK